VSDVAELAAGVAMLTLGVVVVVVGFGMWVTGDRKRKER
jgi:hypothetical protein